MPFNSAMHTPESRAENLQLKIGFSHNITPKLLYTLKASRLDLKTESSVLDDLGNQKAPAEFSTAGLPVTLPDGTFLNAGVSNAVWYTDDDFPYFVTAYDYPFFSNQESIQYLFKGDVVSDQFKGHRIKTGVQMLYNDLNDDERVNPAQTRIDENGMIQQGLNVNIYENFNAEGAVYFQDKWDYEGMVVNGGLRYEWFTVGNNSQVDIASPEIDQSVDQFKWNISPRLGVAFPITDRDKFFFHYGRFTQWPSRTYLFHTQDPVGSTGTLGNPNLEPELTVSYQAGIAHQFTDDIAAQLRRLQQGHLRAHLVDACHRRLHRRAGVPLHQSHVRELARCRDFAREASDAASRLRGVLHVFVRGRCGERRGLRPFGGGAHPLADRGIPARLGPAEHVQRDAALAGSQQVGRHHDLLSTGRACRGRRSTGSRA